MKVEKVDLSHFWFRGNLRSAFLGSSEFVWGVWRPSKSQPGVWKEVDKAEALKDGGNPIFMAAVVQPLNATQQRPLLALTATLLTNIRWPLFCDFLSAHVTEPQQLSNESETSVA